MTLCQLIGNIDQSQTEGVFGIPEGIIEGDETIRRFVDRISTRNGSPKNIVIDTERYCIPTLPAKLESGTSPWLPKRLVNLGILRRVNGEKPKSKGNIVSVDPLSLAQAISFASETPIETIYLSREAVKGRAENMGTIEKIDFLFEVYSGVFWFENFKRKFRRDNPVCPTIPKDARIKMRDLQKYGLGFPDRGHLRFLDDAGFISFKEENSVLRGANIVDNDSLVYLLSKLSGKEPSQIEDMPRGISNEQLAHLFIYQSIIPFMEERKILPKARYNLKQGARLGNVNPVTIRRTAKGGFVKQFKENGVYVVLGIDLAEYCLKNSNGEGYTDSKIAQIFGLPIEDIGRLGFKKNKKGTYCWAYDINPRYKTIVEKANEIMTLPKKHRSYALRIDDIENERYDRRSLFISLAALMGYCIDYDQKIEEMYSHKQGRRKVLTTEGMLTLKHLRLMFDQAELVKKEGEFSKFWYDPNPKSRRGEMEPRFNGVSFELLGDIVTNIYRERKTWKK
ncbi:MAG: hypothetical protein ABIJ08_03265 [Nanoarchaeota archaeon]